MSMINRKAYLACHALICSTLLILTSPAVAFDAATRIERNLDLNAGCRLRAFVHNTGELASVRVQPLGAASTLIQAAGGANFFNGGVSGAFGAITTANLEANCGLTDVDSLTQTGATGFYAPADYIGVTFEATSTSDGNRYSYLAEISGAVATTVTISRTLLNTAPTATLSNPSGPDGSGNYTVTATLSENSSDFTAASLTLSNATATVTGSGSNYTIALSPITDGQIGVSVQRGAFTDSEGLGNWDSSNALSLAYDGVKETQRIIAQFMQSRVNQLIAHQPDLTSLLSGGKSGGVDLAMNDTGGNFDFASATDTDNALWVRLNGSWTNETSRETQYVFGAFGSHYAISPQLLVGGMVELDYVRQQDGVEKVDGQGWLAGFYVVARAPNHPLFFDGRLLYGQTTNDVSPFGTYEDRFETERWLAQVKFSGELAYSATTVIPSLQLTYTTDEQQSYTNSLDILIPQQGVEVGQLELAVDFRHQIPLKNDRTALELTGGIAAIGSATRGTGNADLVTPEYEGGRARLKMGTNYTLENGSKLILDTFYDGIGTGGYESYGLQLGFSLAF